jgi:hypothetical protein
MAQNKDVFQHFNIATLGLLDCANSPTTEHMNNNGYGHLKL